MNRIDRLTSILITVQSKRATTVHELADKYSISTRTVYRDIKALEEAGVPIVFIEGKGYRLMDGYHLPPVMITREEASALLIAEKLLGNFNERDLQEQFSSLATKIKSVLRYTDQEYLEKIDSTTRVHKWDTARWGYESTDYLLKLQKAIAGQNLVEMHYDTARAGKITQRIVEPIGITQYGMGWHLIAWCRLRKEYRDFRIDRIKQFKMLDETFQLREEDPLHAYLKAIHEEHPYTNKTISK